MAGVCFDDVLASNLTVTDFALSVVELGNPREDVFISTMPMTVFLPGEAFGMDLRSTTELR
jgi:hypothetical protein